MYDLFALRLIKTEERNLNNQFFINFALDSAILRRKTQCNSKVKYKDLSIYQ